MANQSDPLAQLKDIHLPEAVSWWPLAPGWYAVLLLCICAASLLVYYLNKRQKCALAKNQALLLLTAYQKHYEKDHNVPVACARISELLRRVALVYYPRAEVASLHGEAWLHFLNQTGKGVDFNSVRDMLLDAPFKTADTTEIKPLFTQAMRWIKQRGTPCSN